MDVTIRNLDEGTYQRLKARAALAGKTIGEVVTDAILAHLSRPVHAGKQYGWKDMRPMEFRPGNERLSEEIDRDVYGA